MKLGDRVAVVGTRKVGTIIGTGAAESVFSGEKLFSVRLDGRRHVYLFTAGELRVIHEPANEAGSR